MSSRTDVEFLGDIQESMARIEDYIGNMTFEDFLGDRKTQDAIIRNLEVIGEAVKNLSELFTTKHSQIPWKGLAGVRDKLIHHYFGVNFDVVWSIINSPYAVDNLTKSPRWLRICNP